MFVFPGRLCSGTGGRPMSRTTLTMTCPPAAPGGPGTSIATRWGSLPPSSRAVEPPTSRWCVFYIAFPAVCVCVCVCVCVYFIGVARANRLTNENTSARSGAKNSHPLLQGAGTLATLNRLGALCHNHLKHWCRLSRALDRRAHDYRHVHVSRCVTCPVLLYSACGFGLVHNSSTVYSCASNE